LAVLVIVTVISVASSLLFTGVPDALHSDSSKALLLGSPDEVKTVAMVEGPETLGFGARDTLGFGERATLESGARATLGVSATGIVEKGVEGGASVVCGGGGGL
jgi:hypothetical protein